MNILGKVTSLVRGQKIPVQEAESILGKENVFSREGHSQDPMYTKEIFEFCAAENRKEKKWEPWKLVFVPDDSLWQMREKHPTEFELSHLWEEHPKWLDEKPKAGYRLLKFKLVSMSDKEEKLSALASSGIKCAPSKIVTVASSLIAIKHQIGARFLSGKYHCGEEHIKNSGIISTIGWKSNEGLMLSTFVVAPPRNNPQRIGIVLCVEPMLGLFHSKSSTT